MQELTIKDLQPGDMLLYSGQSPIGKLIRKLDGTEATHAGVYLGDGQVGEALMVGNPGINANSLSLEGSNWIEVRRLKDSSLTRLPIVDVANAYIARGNRYAYAEILLLAVILATRKVDLGDSWLGRIIFNSMMKANDWIEDMFSDNREPMICSEFAFRCYDEADPSDNALYTLKILSQEGRSHRKMFSRVRRGRRSSEDQPESEVPTIHPESLLAKSLEEPTRFVTAAPATEETMISNDELERMIEDYLDQGTKKTYGALPTAASEPVTEEQLIQVVAEFAAKLESPRTKSVGDSSYSSAPVGSRVMDTFADFVTPGDLLKSPSLDVFGRLS